MIKYTDKLTLAMKQQIANYTIDELKVGHEVCEKRLLTKKDIQTFANLTSDFHPLHTDLKYSQENGFKNIIAHGLLLSSFSSKIIGMKLPGENAMVVSQKFDYKKPVYPGTLLLIKAVLEKIDLRFSILDISVKISSIDKKELFSYGKYVVKVREKI